MSPDKWSPSSPNWRHRNRTSSNPNHRYSFSINFLFTLANLFPAITHSLVFNIPHFDPLSIQTLVLLEGDATVSISGDIQLTKRSSYHVGRVVSLEPLHLWEPSNGSLADFTTRFSFRYEIYDGSSTDDGLAFFLAPVYYPIPSNSTGTYFGLLNSTTVSYTFRNQLVMVEFDSYPNVPPGTYDPDEQHVGININSLASVAYAPWNATANNGKTAHVCVSYNSTTMNLTVTWAYEETVPDPRVINKSRGFLSYVVDLKTILPPLVTVGISAATGQELVDATNGFADERKLGRGGSGQVYKGTLSDIDHQVAVKRIFGESEQSERIFFNEVKVISRIMHRNLVQFVGWCHERNEFLLVYDYMPNGSLDSHLFGDRKTLPWDVRYKIALGLASALNYLHEEAEQCVLHRDIKPANVLLDTDFSTKLGDFGVAKLVDPQLRTDRTTVLVGTFGYVAPEYANVGRVSKESDMYSFGVVALEIACGRKCAYQYGEFYVTLINWVWKLHLEGNIMEAADERLDMNFDPNQMEALLKVGLWCTNPNEKERPKAGQVIKVLQLDAPLPELNKPLDLHSVELHSVLHQQTTNFSQTSSLSPSTSV